MTARLDESLPEIRGGARWLLGDDAERMQPEIVRLAEAWLARDGEMSVTRHGGAFIGRA